MNEPLKNGINRWLLDYYRSVVPQTNGVQEFSQRGLANSIVWAPGRMIDQAEKIVSAWSKDEATAVTEGRPSLPVIVVALGRETEPARSDRPKPISTPQYIRLREGGPVYQLRTLPVEYRCQIIFIAQDSATSESLGNQLRLHTEAHKNFSATHELAGVSDDWNVRVDMTDQPLVAIDTEAKNLSIHAFDCSLSTILPYVNAPSDGDLNDGSAADVPGYPVTTDVALKGNGSL